MRTKEEIQTEIKRLELLKREATDEERGRISAAITALNYALNHLTSAYFR